MKPFTLLALLILVALPQQSSAGILNYLASYYMNREYASRHAPYAVTRSPREWLSGEPVIVEIRNSTILWVRLAPKSTPEELERRFLEPLAYYSFFPLVEADCALNGHPARPKYKWQFFGRNLE